MSEGPSEPIKQAEAAILESIEAFGEAAGDELYHWAHLEVSRKAAKDKLATLHRQRRAELKRITEAFTRQCVTKEDRALLQTVLEISLKGLDTIYKKHRRIVHVMLEKVETSAENSAYPDVG